jgi:DNA-binding transcriptional regulator GbsR (MarR family)
MSKKLEEEDSEGFIREVEDMLLREWGRMGNSWGISRTMAQVHALLYISARPMTVEEICRRLDISRGNASMTLRNLMDWGVVRRFRPRGERHDVYEGVGDAVAMIARVVRERKRREIDPTVDVVRSCLEILPEEGGDEVARLRERVEGLLEVFEAVDLAFRFAMTTDERFRFLVRNRQKIKALLEQWDLSESQGQTGKER